MRFKWQVRLSECYNISSGSFSYLRRARLEVYVVAAFMHSGSSGARDHRYRAISAIVEASSTQMCSAPTQLVVGNQRSFMEVQGGVEGPGGMTACGGLS
jgi:hypothetical protein